MSSLSGASMGGMAAWACDPGAYDACTGMHVCQLLSLRSSLIFVFSSLVSGFEHGWPGSLGM